MAPSPTDRPTSWWLDKLRDRAAAEETLELGEPISWASDAERTAAVRFFNAAFQLSLRVEAVDGKVVPEVAEILLDGRQPPLEVFFGERPGRANLEISLEADLLHAMWLGVESTQQAFLTGRIRTRGNLLKAMQLVELFAEAERIYPAVAQQYGLPGA